MTARHCSSNSRRGRPIRPPRKTPGRRPPPPQFARERKKNNKRQPTLVMAGLDPAIFPSSGLIDVDARPPSPLKLRRATSSLGRRSLGEGGKTGHDER